MNTERTMIETKRHGGKFEMIGTALILSSMAGCIALHSASGATVTAITASIGIGVFLYGRFY